MPIEVPIATIEKPLTAIDYIAVLQSCQSVTEISQYAEACPEAVREDERFARAVAGRLAAIRETK